NSHHNIFIIINENLIDHCIYKLTHNIFQNNIKKLLHPLSQYVNLKKLYIESHINLPDTNIFNMKCDFYLYANIMNGNTNARNNIYLMCGSCLNYIKSTSSWYSYYRSCDYTQKSKNIHDSNLCYYCFTKKLYVNAIRKKNDEQIKEIEDSRILN